MSSWRLPYYDPSLFRNKIFSYVPNKSAKIKKQAEVHTYLRRSKIPGHFLDKRVAVHNGKTFTSFIVKDWMLTHKFGEFVVTKKLGRTIHEKKKKKSR